MLKRKDHQDPIVKVSSPIICVVHGRIQQPILNSFEMKNLELIFGSRELHTQQWINFRFLSKKV